MKQELKNTKFVKASVHVLAWIVLLFFQYLQFPEESVSFTRMIASFWMPLAQFAVIFYLNYYLFIKKFLFRNRLLLFIVLNCLIIASFIFINLELRDLFFKPDIQRFMQSENISSIPPNGFPGPGRMMRPPRKLFMFRDLVTFFVSIVFSIAVRATDSLIKTEAERRDIENKNLEAELLHLRYQIQPHFFFNSLNNIYSLVDNSPEKAQEAIHSLSKLMRYLLYDTGNKKVDLTKEIQFLEKYIKLMELRQTDKTRTTFSFPEILEAKYFIEPLLFIPLIENAYKHCVSATQHTNISFNMNIDKNNLIFYCENTNVPKTDSDKSGSGIGLENLKKRLELLYPDRHLFEYGIRENIFWVKLNIELDPVQ
jgi:two-component sensor histidine kinase